MECTHTTLEYYLGIKRKMLYIQNVDEYQNIYPEWNKTDFKSAHIVAECGSVVVWSWTWMKG